MGSDSGCRWGFSLSSQTLQVLSWRCSTCRCLAVPPVKVPGVDPRLQRASDRVGTSLDVSLKQFSVQPSNRIHTHLEHQEKVMLLKQSGNIQVHNVSLWGGSISVCVVVSSNPNRTEYREWNGKWRDASLCP